MKARKDATDLRPTSGASPVRRAIAIAIAGGVAGSAWSPGLLAGPTDGRVTAGEATISTPDASLTRIQQSSDRAIIDWRSFSIDRGEAVEFLQPSSSAATLNRVLGGQQSVIEGALRANGNVLLLNPSGILFGRDAAVDVGGLVASTSRMTNEDFLAGRFNLQAGEVPGAAVENQGAIRIRDGGAAALVAPTVRNHGTIVARLGKVALAGMETVTVDLYGDQLLSLALPPGSEVGSSGSGAVAVTAGDAAALLDQIVNRTGLESATVARMDGDALVLSIPGTVEHAGHIDVSGNGNAGSVTLLGRNVRLTPDSMITADAIAAGHGGRVVAFGTGSTTFDGSITARGGNETGDGGFVEVSGLQLLQVFGDVVATATSGKSGTVLLDPREITITSDGPHAPGEEVLVSRIDGDALTAMLRNGQNVVLAAEDSITVQYRIDGRPLTGSATSGSVSLTAGTIVIEAPVITNNAGIDLTATSGDVTIRGNGFLYVADGVGHAGSAAINIDAAGRIRADASGGAGQLISLGTITLTAGTDVDISAELAGLRIAGQANRLGALVITAETGRIQLQGVDSRQYVELAAATGINLGNSGIRADGNVVLDGGSGGITISANAKPLAAAIEAQGAGRIDIQSAGTISVGGSLRTEGGNIVIDGPGDGAGAVSVVAGATIEAGCSVTDLDTCIAGGNVVIRSQDAVTLRGLLAGGGIEVTGASIANVDEPLVARSGNIVLTADGRVEIGPASGSTAAAEAKGLDMSVTINNAGALELLGSILTNGGNIQLGGETLKANSITTAPGAVLDTGGATGSVTIKSQGPVTLHGINSGDKIQITGASLISSQNPLMAQGEVIIDVSGLIHLRCVEENAACDSGSPSIQSNDAVTLTTLGLVQLDGSIRAGGDVVIQGPGAEGRIAALTMGDGTVIQAAANASPEADETITIRSAGSILAGNLIVGSRGVILLDAEASTSPEAPAVELREGLGGVSSQGQSGAASGIGRLQVTAGGRVVLNGVTSSGALDSTAIEIGGTGIELRSASLVVESASNLTRDTPAVVLTASGNQDDAILVDQLPGSAPGIEVRGGGSVDLLTQGGVLLGSGIRAANGNINLGTETSKVKSLSGLSGDDPAAFLKTSTAGDISIHASQAVALGGTDSAGAVTVTAQRITNDVATITALGDVNLMADSGGIRIGCIGTEDQCDGTYPEAATADDLPGLGIQSQGRAILATTGDVELSGGIQSRRDIQIGETSTPHAVIMGAHTSLQAEEGITATLGSGTSTFQSLVAGGSSGITIESAGSIRLLGGVSGPNGPTGFLNVTANSIESHEILTSGPQGVRLVVRKAGNDPSSGRLDVLGQVESRGGPILLGLDAPDPGGNNAQINLSHNLITSGYDITINGDVTLFDGIRKWDIDPEAGPLGDLFVSSGLELDPSWPNKDDDTWWLHHNPLTFGTCLTTITDCFEGGGEVFRFETEAAFTAWLEWYNGDQSEDPPVFIDGPDPIVWVNLGQRDELPQVEEGQFDLLFDHDSIPFDRMVVQVNVNGQDFFRFKEFNPVGSMAPYFLRSLIATGQNAPVRSFPGPDQCAADAWACGYQKHHTQEMAWLLAQENAARYREIFGQLIATIDTTSGSAAGANLNVNGNIGRYVPADAFTNASNVPGVVRDTFTHHTLKVDLGSTGVMSVDGRLGDDIDQARLTASFSGLDDQVTPEPLTERQVQISGQSPKSVPHLGLFRLDLTGADEPLEIRGSGNVQGFMNEVTVNGAPLATPNVWEEPDPAADLPYWESTGGGLYTGGTLTIVERTYLIGNPWTNQTEGTFNASGDPIRPEFTLPRTFGSVPSEFGTATGPSAAAGRAGEPAVIVSTGGRGAGSAIGGVGFTFLDLPSEVEVGGPPGGPGGPGGDPDTGTDSVPPAAENTLRDDQSDSDPADSEEENLLCPRGASRTADVGNTPGVQGSAPAVFKRCEQDFT